MTFNPLKTLVAKNEMAIPAGRTFAPNSMRCTGEPLLWHRSGNVTTARLLAEILQLHSSVEELSTTPPNGLKRQAYVGTVHQGPIPLLNCSHRPSPMMIWS